MSGLGFDPGLPWPLIGLLAALSLAAAGLALARGLRGWALRAAAGLVLALALAGPVLDTAARRGLDDIVVLLDDRSASQTLPGRAPATDEAVARLAAQIAAMPGTQLRRVTVADDADGTPLGAALARAIAAEPEARLAGVIAVTDGRLHDPAALPQTAPAPVHVLLTGGAADWDRRLVVEEAPAFGLIGQPVTLRLRIEDQGAVPDAIRGRPARLALSLDGEAQPPLTLPPGVTVEVPVTPAHSGANVVALAIDAPQAQPAQLTDRNDAAALTITGVRERLRVLLVSGEPHPGERTWRNLLKSDAGVDLVHFTLLRPPDKFDGVPQDEIALIAFPIRQLFLERIRDFDLIIFDRYRERGVLPPEYFDSIRDYVEAGGALLVAGGPEMASVEGLGMTRLGAILPGDPTGRVIDAPLTPYLTDKGQRHPVTAGLPGAPRSQDEGGPQPGDRHWGRWLRAVEVRPREGAQVVMTADDDQPLLLLQRVGKGRVAMLASDQVWLWARGFEGGGPQLELLRRIAHWSMQEPELEEEALSAEVRGGLRLRVTRRTMAPQAGPVTITGPDGAAVSRPLAEAGPGRFTAEWTAPGPGLYRLAEGDLRRVVALGPAAPREFEQTVADAAPLQPLVGTTGGAVLRLADGLPALRRVAPGRPAAGQGVAGPWIGLAQRGAETVTGRSLRPLLPPWGWLAMIAALMIGAWLAEGGRRLRRG